MENPRKDRRTNSSIRRKIISIFEDKSSEALTIMQISKRSDIDWYTTERHLNYLKGREFVSEVFSHPRIRLYQLTDAGFQAKKYLLFVKQKYLHNLQKISQEQRQKSTEKCKQKTARKDVKDVKKISYKNKQKSKQTNKDAYITYAEAGNGHVIPDFEIESVVRRFL